MNTWLVGIRQKGQSCCCIPCSCKNFKFLKFIFAANGTRKIETCPPREQYINCFKISGNEKGNYVYVNNLRLWTGLFKILLLQANGFIIYIL